VDADLGLMNPGIATAVPVTSEDSIEYPPGLIPPSQRQRSRAAIGEVIVELGFASRETVEAAVAFSREEGKTTGQVLVESGAITADQLARALAERFGVDYIDLSLYEVDPAILDMLDASVARRYQSVPVGVLGDGSVLLAMADPTNVLTLDEISMITGRTLRPAAVAGPDLVALIAKLGRRERREVVAPDEPVAEVEISLSMGADPEAPVVKLVQDVIGHAVELGASDVHLDPTPGDMQVLYRVDGVLTADGAVPRAMAASVVSRVKIMGGLDIAERRAPQDGRMQFKLDERSVDVRVVSLPLVRGEGVVMRILDTNAVVRDLGSLGMRQEERSWFESALQRPYGAILVTGPTGSGKTTSLYGGIALINDGERSILTIEDPVESPIEGIKQMQVAVKAGVTFATGLRSILRADPDVIMVGEIRDRETAEIATQAALTGHLMLSTLHTRDAASSVTRLVDMGIEPFMVAAAIDCVVAQRLARVLCESCKRPAKLPPEVLIDHGLGGAEVFEAVGCLRCNRTGYRGRVGLYEVMVLSDDIRELLMANRGVDAIAAAAIGQGMRTMRQDGIEKVREGVTSLVEVGRVTPKV
jgi:type IV pilus assembly protein PilB